MEEELIITIFAQLELYDTTIFIDLKEKPRVRYMKFAPLQYFEPSLFQMLVHALLSGSYSPVWTAYAKSAERWYVVTYYGVSIA